MKTLLRGPSAACILLGLACPVMAQDVSPAPAQLSPAAKYLLTRIHPGVARESFIQSLRNDAAGLDANANGELSAADAELHKAIAVANAASQLVTEVVRADTDGDGAASEDELRQRARYERRSAISQGQNADFIEQAVRMLMAADANNDGKVSIDEAREHGRKQQQSSRAMGVDFGARVSEMLALAPAGKNVVSLKEIGEAGAAFFSSVDSDKSNTVSKEEIEAYRVANGAPTPEEEARERQRKQAEQLQARREAEQLAACPMPKASENAKVLLLSAYESDALSTATIGSQDVVTGTGSITVEPGSEPLYVVVAAFAPTIWRFTGAVDRIEQVVLSAVSGGNNRAANDISRAGVTGIPAGRVSFLKSKCLGYFKETPSSEAAKAAGLVRKQLEKTPAVVAGRYKVSGFALPAGEIRTTGRPDQPTLVIEKPAGTLTIRGGANVVVQAGAGDLASDVARYYPGGVVEVDPASVVASQAAERYNVLPSQAGLLQLVQKGALTRNKSGEYLIKEKIRFPAGLYGAHSVKFLLLRGTPEPEGDPGHSCVIVEETGEPWKQGGSCR